VVIGILSLLAVVAMADYGFATSKARLQISVEGVVALLNQAQVDAQSDPQHCFGVWIGEGSSPEKRVMGWDSDLQVCDYSSYDSSDSVQWSSKVELNEVQWDALSSADVPIPQSTLSELLFVFSPPEGRLTLWNPTTSMSEAYRACVSFSYEGSLESVMQKAINVVPITASFDILGACSD
jgi:type II secretory pathway pseudopilin PulG